MCPAGVLVHTLVAARVIRDVAVPPPANLGDRVRLPGVPPWSIMMGLIGRLTVGVSRVHPLTYIAIYIAAIPAFGLAFAFFCAHQFLAPYARYEPGAVADRLALASDLQNAIQRSLSDPISVGAWTR